MKKIKFLLTFSIMLLGSIPAKSYIYGQYPDAMVRILHDGEHVYFCCYKGVSVLDKTTGSWTSYSYKNGMLPGEMQTAMALHADTLWVGSSNGWVSAICDGKVESWRYKIISDLTKSEFYGNVGEIAFDTQGRMVLGIVNCVMGVVNGEPLQCYPIPSSVCEQSVEGMQFDAHGVLWVACAGLLYENALTRYTFEGGIDFLLKRLEKPHPFQFDHCCCLAVDKNGVLWFNPGNQLVKYDGETFTLQKTITHANDMAFDAQGRLWLVGNYGGLYCFDHGEVTHYPYQREMWFCLDIDGDVIYIGTQNGLLKFENGEFTPFEILESYATAIRPPLAVPDNIAMPRMFTLDGRPIENGSTAKGVIIKNGRKVVQR